MKFSKIGNFYLKFLWMILIVLFHISTSKISMKFKDIKCVGGIAWKSRLFENFSKFAQLGLILFRIFHWLFSQFLFGSIRYHLRKNWQKLWEIGQKLEILGFYNIFCLIKTGLLESRIWQWLLIVQEKLHNSSF